MQYLKTLAHDENLYHYTSCKSVQSILKTGVLYATKSSFLNDTNELAYILELASEMLEEIEDTRYKEILRNEIILTMEEFQRKDVFVLSFSLDPDSITLWSEFGDKTGYNIAFDGKELLSNIASKYRIFSSGHVIYDEKKQRKIIRELLYNQLPHKVNKSFDDIMAEEISHPGTDDFRTLCHEFQKEISLLAIYFKQKEFAPENEYRVAFEKPHRKQINFREKDGFLLPYIKVDVRNNSKLPIRCISVAPKNHVDLAKRGMETYLEYLGYSIDVHLSKLKLRY